MLTRKEFLHRAEECICVDREEQYGNPEDSFEVIAQFWSTYLGYEITAEDVGNMMALLKIGRISTGRHKDDSYVDAIGYLACAGEIASNR